MFSEHGFKELLFEVFSAGFEAALSEKDIRSAYNEWYKDGPEMFLGKGGCQ